jgi:glutathione S-transferase
MHFAELEQARNAKGLRLVVMGGVPSPWSEAAKGIFDIKGIEYLAVRFDPRDPEVKAWTGCHNAPVAMLDGEAARSGWAEILALGERLNHRVSLLPEAPEERVQVYGLSHELLGEGGLAWSGRLLIIHDGLATRGAKGFPERAAAYLGAKYGYAPERIPGARERVLTTLDYLTKKLEANQRRGSAYLVGARVSAADIYLVSVLGLLHPLPADVCPMLPFVRHAFETIDPTVRAAVSEVLLEHRNMMFEKHLQLPREL